MIKINGRQYILQTYKRSLGWLISKNELKTLRRAIHLFLSVRGTVKWGRQTPIYLTGMSSGKNKKQKKKKKKGAGNRSAYKHVRYSIILPAMGVSSALANVRLSSSPYWKIKSFSCQRTPGFFSLAPRSLPVYVLGFYLVFVVSRDQKLADTQAALFNICISWLKWNECVRLNYQLYRGMLQRSFCCSQSVKDKGATV